MLKEANSNTALRSFRIVCGLVQGDESRLHHALPEVKDLIACWLLHSKAAGEICLFGSLTQDPVMAVNGQPHEHLIDAPMAVYAGDVDPVQYGDVPDERIVAALKGLAEILRGTIKPAVLKIVYRDQILCF